MKRLFPLLLFFLPALALKAGWQQIDINGDGKPEHVAVTNLADVAFSDDGRVVGWYVKRIKGRAIKDYGRAFNLVKPGLPAPGFADLPLKAEAFGEEGGRLVARFSGPGGELVYRISPNHYTVEVEARLRAPATLVWSGIGGTDQPVTKLLLKGAKNPVPAGEGEAVYAALATRAKTGYAFVFWPKTPLPTKLTVKNGGALIEARLPAGPTVFRLYGGQHELVRYHVEGLLGLPGLFQPNIWGQLSLALLYLMEAFHRFVGDWGLAILLLTLAVRLLLWPLMHQQFKAMAEMQRIKPLVDELNKKYKDDPEKKNQALMKLYAEHKINPAAGCLPMLIQLPILFVLWRVIANYEFGQGFLWLPDLALPDPYYVLPVLYVAVMFAQTLLMSQGNKDAMRQSLFMNLFFVYLVLQFPAGVTLYWVFSTLIGLLQQWMINKQIKAMPAGG